MKNQRKRQLRYAVYQRCSTDDQRQGDYTTIDTQRELNLAYVRENGGILVKDYSDEGKTGSNLNRPGWKSLLRDAEAGQFDAVCVTYMSRLGRGDSFIIAEHELRKHRVSVVMVREKFTDDLAGYMGKTMTTMMDGIYPKMVSQWTKTKMERMVARGYHCGGITPFGYKAEVVTDAAGFHSADKQPPKRLVPDAIDATIVATAFAIFAESKKIADVRDYLSAVAFSRRWTTTSVKNILTSETYIGVQQFRAWRNESAHPPIVDRELWESVRKCLTANLSRNTKRAVDDYTYYLHGRVKCPHCGCCYTHASHHGRNSRVHYYVCQQAHKGITKCPVTRVNADRLHHTILHEIERAVNHRTVMHRIIAESEGWSSASEQQKSLRGELGKAKQFVAVRIANTVTHLADGRGRDSLLDILEKLERQQAELARQIIQADVEIAAATVKRPTAEQVQSVWGQLTELWDVLTENERTDVLSAIVRSVEVTEKERVTVELMSIPTVHADWFNLKLNMGAVDARGANIYAGPQFDAEILRSPAMRRR